MITSQAQLEGWLTNCKRSEIWIKIERWIRLINPNATRFQWWWWCQILISSPVFLPPLPPTPHQQAVRTAEEWTYNPPSWLTWTCPWIWTWAWTWTWAWVWIRYLWRNRNPWVSAWRLMLFSDSPLTSKTQTELNYITYTHKPFKLWFSN